MKSSARILLIVSLVATLASLAGVCFAQTALFKSSLMLAFLALALALRGIPKLQGYQYTAWIICAVAAGMLYPSAFTHWGNINLRDKTLILIIIQLVMFGMGTHMQLKDFNGLATTGKGVLAGLLCHFTIMPLMGLLLTKIFHFEAEIAAGIILIGSCSSGLASNVMVYLARANLVLSVIITAMATLAAPFCTPLLMKLLAGTLIEIHFFDMMAEIIKIVLVPIGAALLHDYLKDANAQQKKRWYAVGVICLAWILIAVFFLQNETTNKPLLQSLNLSAFFSAAVIAGIVYNYLHARFPGLDKIMPLISMIGIIYFTTVTTAAGRDNLLKVGLLLFIASVIHNAAGYFFGYWFSRLFGMDKNSSRTIAFEVGLQNGGMASGIAGSMGKLGTVGLAAAVFSPWMNISGSILANYWRKRPINEDRVVADGIEEEQVVA
ncbi:MAG: bile acid:sodium symporter family protein [Chitinophagaceae bacterium]